MSESARGSDAVLAFLCGAAVGAGLALLLAPASGRETRHKVADGARRLREGMDGKLADLKETISNRASEIKRDVTDAIEAGRGAASNS